MSYSIEARFEGDTLWQPLVSYVGGVEAFEPATFVTLEEARRNVASLDLFRQCDYRIIYTKSIDIAEIVIEEYPRRTLPTLWDRLLLGDRDVG